MVRASLVSVLIDSINEKKPRKMMPWSQRHKRCGTARSNAYGRLLIKKIRKILKLVSGNNLVEMLSGR